jgi:hypothetical protein
MDAAHPSHVAKPNPVSYRPPQWYSTYCANCGQKILEEAGDVTPEGEQPCPAEASA